MLLIKFTMKHSNISLFVPHAGCPNQCSFCNQKTISGSVRELSTEEVRNTLLEAEKCGLSRENTEIAFFGGSFTAIDRNYMISLLEEAKPFIENGIFSGIRISTRPDAIDEEVLNIFIIKTEDLKRIVEEADAHACNSLTSIFLSSYKREGYYAYSHRGFAATVSDLNEYYKYSIMLTRSQSMRRSLLGNRALPIYTRVKNSAPTSHTESSSVSSSIIADDCIIEGEVVNSVIFRGVHIQKGATVKNSVLFHGTEVGENAKLNCVISDKFASISRGVELSGNSNLPFYIEKNSRI